MKQIIEDDSEMIDSSGPKNNAKESRQSNRPLDRFDEKEVWPIQQGLGGRGNTRNTRSSRRGNNINPMTGKVMEETTKETPVIFKRVVEN